MRPLILVALLAGCGGPQLSENQEAQVRNIATDIADDAADSAPDNLNAGARLEYLEGQAKRSASADITALEAIEELQSENAELRQNLRGVIEHYNKHLVDYHGGRPN